MGRRKREISEATIDKLIKEGRGQGEGQEYQPFLKVQDFSSSGQANRDFGHTTQRQHDYFSKIEHRCHVIFDYIGLHDIQEQKLIPLEKSVEIAKQCGIKHPIDVKTKRLKPLTTDFRLSIPRPIGCEIVALAVKPSVELRKPRIIEKLELERRCWRSDGINWWLTTELDIEPDFLKNLMWTYKNRTLESLYPLSGEMIYKISNMLTDMVRASDSPLNEVALECDDLLSLKAGRSLKVARHLIATRQWEVDIFRLINPCEKLNLIGAAISQQERRLAG